MERCPICAGRKTIRLPVMRSAQVSFTEASVPEEIEDALRTYDCPECSSSADANRIVMFYAEASAPNDVPDEHAEEMIKRDLANRLAQMLISDGYVEILEDPRDTRRVWRARLGVVSKAASATIEQRIRTNQEAVAKKVVAEAWKQISIWGSDYTGSDGEITKRRACDSVERALAIVMEREKTA